MAEYAYLFTPLKVGSVTLKNRVLFAPAAGYNADMDGLLPEGSEARARTVAYLEERAKGGVAWITLCCSPVDERHNFFPLWGGFAWHSDKLIPGVREIADRVHKHGCVLSAQLSHPGNSEEGMGNANLSYGAVGPSAQSQVMTGPTICHELEVDEILETEDLFAKAAERVKKAGCDGVEVMCVHGKLLCSFRSPLLNQRTDQYGGSVENRHRMHIEILRKIREAVGKDFLVGIRLNDTDMVPFGLDVDESVEGAKLIEATGLVDYISLCEGLYRSGHSVIPPAYGGFEPGYRAVHTRKFKAALKVPVVMSGRINDPGVAERLIAEGSTDVVGIARGLMADPYFIKKAMEGKEEDIIPCIGCNQGCAPSFMKPGYSLHCLCNPVTGEEYRWAELPRATSRKKVLIVGAGPGGLECAITLAQRGHEPVIYEKEKEMGGQVNLLRKLPGRSEFGNFMDWLDLQVKKLGVKINLGSEINESNLDQILDKEKPDLVICATGARPCRDGRSGAVPIPIPGCDQPNVFTYEDVIKGAELGKRVLILDDLKERTAPGIAEMLGEQGKEVEILQMLKGFDDFLLETVELALIEAQMTKYGVKITPLTWAIGIRENQVTCIKVGSMTVGDFDKAYQVEADSVVLATHKHANTEIYNALKAKGVQCRLIGDAYAPRYILNAVRDGYEVAREI